MASEQLVAAIGCHQGGDLRGAERLYRAILRDEPNQPDALHLLGVLARQCGRIAEAISLIERAAAQMPNHPLLLYNLALAMSAAGQDGAAIENYRRAIAAAPGLAEAWQNLGAIHEKQDELEAARHCFARVVQLRAGSAEARSNLGHVLMRLGRLQEALSMFDDAVRIAPDEGRALLHRAACLQELGRLAEARAALEACLRVEPENWAAWNNLGRVLQQSEELNQAIAAFERALAIAPAAYEVLVNTGTAYKDALRFDEATAMLKRGISLFPERAEAWHNLAKVFEEQGQLQSALTHYDEAVQRDPQHPEIRLNRAFVLLQLGEHERGWSEYEWRWRTKDAPEEPKLPVATWDGSSLEGKSILVYGEQGVGDEIMWATCYPDLLASAKQVTIVCQPRLEALLARSFPAARIMAAPRGEEDWATLVRPEIDVAIAAGSVPRHVRRRECDYPKHARLFMPDAQAVAAARRRLAALGPGLKVGISWRAGTTPKLRRHRSTDLQDWTPLLSVAGTRWINLQYGDCGNDLAQIQTGGISIASLPEIDPLRDLDGLAAYVAALDLVISVGNATVHLAGAVGTPCWALLPCHWGWRWGIDREDTPWYGSVRLLRQRKIDDWAELFQRAAAKLKAELQAWLPR